MKKDATDEAWEEWGRRDPYFGVITNQKFRRSELTSESRREFFESGEAHVQWLFATIKKHIEATFHPKTILDFGCGVGRLLLPFAKSAEIVVGLDVSSSMLKEARQNCDETQINNVKLFASDDNLSAISGTFDLIHSSIVFQHIPMARGCYILKRLLSHLPPGGVGAIHLLYSKDAYAGTNGLAPQALSDVQQTELMADPHADPEIQMNTYNMNEVLFVLQRKGVCKVYIDFTDHGGELGAFLLFQRPLI